MPTFVFRTLVVWLFAAMCFASEIVSAQPDSVDYHVWVREALLHGLRGFDMRVVEMHHEDTLSNGLFHFKLSRQGGRVVLRGNHLLELGSRHEMISSPDLHSSRIIPNSYPDSVTMELDSQGRMLAETIWHAGKLESILHWRYDDHGRLINYRHDYARDGWHPEEEYIYDATGNLLQADLRNSDGTLAGNHTFHRRDKDPTGMSANELVEYDTSYAGGEGRLTAMQITAFDFRGRVQRYMIRTFGLDGKTRTPFGIFSVYHDSIGSYRCEQYAYESGDWTATPARAILYDSIRHEETRIAPDTGTAVLTVDNRYLPDERLMLSKSSSESSGIASYPLNILTCSYTTRGALEVMDKTDYKTATRRILRFSYDYPTMGP